MYYTIHKLYYIATLVTLTLVWLDFQTPISVIPCVWMQNLAIQDRKCSRIHTLHTTYKEKNLPELEV